MSKLAHLPSRAVLSVSGADRVSFLNGLVSNDVALAAPGRAVWAALLTAQGKWLADFFIFAEADRLLMDCEAAQAGMLAQRLSRYRLRADVAIAPDPAQVFAAWAAAPEAADAVLAPEAADAVLAPDPRLARAGWRLLTVTPPHTNADEADWDAHRLALGLPDGSRDLEAEKTVLLEAGFDELDGVSWTKGCYMGQELTARTRYRGLVKRRLVPVSAETELPAAGTPIFAGEREVGQMRSSRADAGLALLRLDAIGAPSLVADGARLTVRLPAWMRVPAPA